MIATSQIYQAFRRILSRELKERICGDNVIHVGEAVQCLRKSFYARKYGDLELSHLSDAKVVVLGLGLAAHRVLEEILQEAGYKTEHRVELDLGDFKLVGTPDAANDDHVLEIKTCNKIPEKPYVHHVMQLNTYLSMMGYATGYIVYICKANGNVAIYAVQRNERLFNELLERAAKLYLCLKEDTIPEPERSYLCNFCEWRITCMQGR